MKLSDSERRLARELIGLSPLDFCPVVLVAGYGTPQLVGEAGHYIDTVGRWLCTPQEMHRAGVRGRHYVTATRAIEVSAGWLSKIRKGPWGCGKGAPR